MMGKLGFILLLLTVLFAQVSLAQNRDRKNVNPNVTIHNATQINTGAFEFSPMFYGNGIVFVSSRLKGGLVDQGIGETFYDIFYADLNREGMPQRPESFSIEINSILHEGPVSFDRQENHIYFTRSNQVMGTGKAGTTGRVVLKIFEADRGAYDWENIRELPFNNSDFSCMHPAVNETGDRLFFVSNMPGGYGGMDIYMADKEGDSWSEPINLGPDINTSKDEVFPYFLDNGMLFFASNGHKGQGGLDIFMIDISSNKWGSVINIGAPFNSEADDFGLILNREGDKGYFTSSRPGGKGKDDIYMFDAPGGVRGIKGADVYATRVVVYDSETGRPASGVSVRIFERSEEGLIKNDSLYSLELSQAGAGNNDLSLRMVRKKDADMGAPRLVTGKEGEGIIQMEADKDYVILVSKDGFKSQELYFSPQEAEAGIPLQVKLERNNCITLRGTVVAEVNEKPIPHAQVRIVNSCTNAEEVLWTKMDGSYDYCLEIGCNYVISGQKEGFRSGQTQINAANVRGSRSFTSTLRLVAGSVPVAAKKEEPAGGSLAEGSVIVLENIYYDFNKTVIRTGQAHELEALARLMIRFPSLKVELGAHTDSRGSEEYNLDLSIKRAEAAKNYLVRKGIAPERIRAVGYGESQIRNHCKDGVECSEMEHQFNRRTEVKVIHIDEPTGNIPVLKSNDSQN